MDKQSFSLAGKKDIQTVFDLTHVTIEAIYPLYYPHSVVEFFHNHHALDKIVQDVEAEKVFLLRENGYAVGTATIQNGNEAGRLFILPAHQGLGFGRLFMDYLENKVAHDYPTLRLDASLPAIAFYLQRGYRIVSNKERHLAGGGCLCYNVMEKNLPFFPSAVSYDGRVFTTASNEEHGEVSGDTRFYYHQRDNMIWAEYAGGMVRKGFLIGTSDQAGTLTFTYQHLNRQDELRIGRCVSMPEVMEDGRLRMHESWQWLDGERQEGKSIVEEVK